MCTKVPYPNRWLARRVLMKCARPADRSSRSIPASRTTPVVGTSRAIRAVAGEAGSRGFRAYAVREA